MFGIQADEGEIFINLLFHGILNGSQRKIQVTPRLYRRFVEFVFPKSFEKILNKYPPPCQNNNNAECDCAQNMKDILTGSTMSHVYNHVVHVYNHAAPGGLLYTMYENMTIITYRFGLIKV